MINRCECEFDYYYYYYYCYYYYLFRWSVERLQGHMTITKTKTTGFAVQKIFQCVDTS